MTGAWTFICKLLTVGVLCQVGKVNCRNGHNSLLWKVGSQVVVCRAGRGIDQSSDQETQASGTTLVLSHSKRSPVPTFQSDSKTAQRNTSKLPPSVASPQLHWLFFVQHPLPTTSHFPHLFLHHFANFASQVRRLLKTDRAHHVAPRDQVA